MLRKILAVSSEITRFFITYIPGGSGRKIRYWYYKEKFKRCGRNVLIDEGVIIQNPKWISLGDNVWIDKYSILMAGKLKNQFKMLKRIENKNFTWVEGELIIGSGVHIGISNILQAHGGLYIGNNVTLSAGVKIYSLSNYPYFGEKTEIVTFANCMVHDQNKVPYILAPIVIEDGVWIALDCLVLGGTIGKNSFISSQSIVYKDIPKNSYACGNPAKKVKERFNLRQAND